MLWRVIIRKNKVHITKILQGISSTLRKDGFKTLNFGKGGNGMLIEFATLKEYAEPIQPKIVLWLYFDNDFYDLKNEMNSFFLRKYLDDSSFTQNLISRQNEIDNNLKDYALNKMIDKGNNKIIKKENNKMNIISNILKLQNFRSIINLKPKAKILDNEMLMLFPEDILEKSQNLVSKWGAPYTLSIFPHLTWLQIVMRISIKKIYY